VAVLVGGEVGQVEATVVALVVVREAAAAETRAMVASAVEVAPRAVER
jgi:hypothetical protein